MTFYRSLYLLNVDVWVTTYFLRSVFAQVRHTKVNIFYIFVRFYWIQNSSVRKVYNDAEGPYKGGEVGQGSREGTDLKVSGTVRVEST